MMAAWSRSIFRVYLRWESTISRRKWAVIGTVALASFGLSVMMSWLNWPIPTVHDEFAYLLGADTFASGRLTNPTHPMWEHFESYHIFHQPSYQMKYPPGQSWFLALGQRLGHPLIGVWLSWSLAAAASCWMLQGWVPAVWAMRGSVLILVSLLATNWSQNYWGGAVAMLGGALTFGAVIRISHGSILVNSWVLGVGLFLMANSRPYEGALAGLCAMGYLIGWLSRSHAPAMRVLMYRFLLPLCLMMAMLLVWTGYYNYTVTGSVYKLPYQQYHETYARPVTYFIFGLNGSEEPPRRTLRISSSEKTSQESDDQTVRKTIKLKAFYLGSFYFGLLNLPFLLLVPCLLKEKKVWFVTLTLGLVTTAVILQKTSSHPHYTAPVAALMFLLLIQCLRWLSVHKIYPARVWHLVALLVFLGSYPTWALEARSHESWATRRHQIESGLKERGSKHLILVRYAEEHDILQEWVYNRADIDQAPVVWARSLSPEKDQALKAYFDDRVIWLLEPDHGVKLTKLSMPETESSSAE